MRAKHNTIATRWTFQRASNVPSEIGLMCTALTLFGETLPISGSL